MMWDAFVAWDANVASKADNTKESQNCSFFVQLEGAAVDAAGSKPMRISSLLATLTRKISGIDR